MASQSDGYSRRTFIKTSALASAALSTGILGTGNFAYAAGSDTIKIGLIGCGGRGTGAIRDSVVANTGIVLHAMGDLYEDRLDSSIENLKEPLGAALQVGDRKFFGFDAYQQVINTDVDMIILATPPVFRPMHLRAAIEAGKHVFMEKPVAVDPAGVRSVFESADLAATKGLGIVAGTQRRHDPRYVEVMRRVHDGAIGDVLSGQVYWNQGGLWKKDRQPGQSDMEWQTRNWLYFTWLSGDHIVEQHIHNLDVANWIMKSPPIKANGVGGRQARVDPAYGHIFDHFAIELEYPNGAHVLSMCRQQDGTSRRVGEHFIGSQGTTDAYSWIKGPNAWAFDGVAVNPYEQEHADLVASIRAGEPLNEARRVAESTLTAIMCREAAYTGKLITWDEIMAADLDLTPDTFAFGPLPTAPVPTPGMTQLSRPPYAHAHPAPNADTP